MCGGYIHSGATTAEDRLAGIDNRLLRSICVSRVKEDGKTFAIVHSRLLRLSAVLWPAGMKWMSGCPKGRIMLLLLSSNTSPNKPTTNDHDLLGCGSYGMDKHTLSPPIPLMYYTNHYCGRLIHIKAPADDMADLVRTKTDAIEFTQSIRFHPLTLS